MEFETEEKCILHLQKLIENGKNLCETNGYTSNNKRHYFLRPISEVIERGYIQAFKLCVPNHVRLNATVDRSTLLIIAIRRKKIEIIEYLISCGANVCQKDSYGGSPLSVAVTQENLDIIEMLLNHGAKFNLQTALIDAISTKNLSIIKCFIENGALVNFRYEVVNENTPLHQAINTGKMEVVELLIKNGADPNLRELNNILTEKGANVNQIGDNGKLPLMRCFERENYKTATFLVEHGADVNISDYSGKIPLIEAISTQDLKLIKCVLEKVADVNTCDPSGKIPLIEAIPLEDLELIKSMVKKGADVNAITKDNQQCALSLAAKRLNIPIFEFLIQSGAKVELAKHQLEEIAQKDEDFKIYFQRMTNTSKLSGSGHE